MRAIRAARSAAGSVGGSAASRMLNPGRYPRIVARTSAPQSSSPHVGQGGSASHRSRHVVSSTSKTATPPDCPAAVYATYTRPGATATSWASPASAVAGPTASGTPVAAEGTRTGRSLLIPPEVSTTYAHGNPAASSGRPCRATEPVTVPADASTP